ncbi:MAG: hypothetical protein VR72_01480 [Clostridiaceae bacterium BRH_c20a]|nr:MAG: hypothetical protein VR72_01480 [Clostridiaceae bacterium BRH_c20a]
MYGYKGGILHINLSTRRTEKVILSEEILQQFIGGTSLGAYLITKFSNPRVSSLSNENPIIFLTGPFTGTNIPTSGRFAVVSRSPATNIWGESDSGGIFGDKLKRAGYDGLIVTGCSAKPVYIFIDNDIVEIRDAEFLWGKDTYETTEMILEYTPKNTSIACIGPGGENLIPFASIISEGIDGRAAGRCGLGTVMGSKKLKAIAVKGDTEIEISDSHGLRKKIKEVIPPLLDWSTMRKKYGTAGGVVGNAIVGDMPAKNWDMGNWVEEAHKISGERLASEYLVKSYHCPHCFIGCGRVVRIPRGKFTGTIAGGPEYETLAGFGSLCLIDDIEVVIEANDACNRLGLDTISTSGVIAFAMEAIEKGLLLDDSNTPPLIWGNGEAIIYYIYNIVYRNGLGEFLALGVKKMAERLGSSADEFAMHVKGLEFPYHDPRALTSLAVAYATGPRGACHRQCTHILERNGIAEIGFPKALDRFSSEDKGRLVAVMQNYSELYNALKLCQFLIPKINVYDIVEMLNLVTGWEFNLEKFLLVGERSITLKRLINLKYGMKIKEEERLPPRIFKSLTEGGTEGNVPDFEKMLHDYYSYRGWTIQGNPTEELLDKLNLRYDFWSDPNETIQ